MSRSLRFYKTSTKELCQFIIQTYCETCRCSQRSNIFFPSSGLCHTLYDDLQYLMLHSFPSFHLTESFKSMTEY